MRAKTGIPWRARNRLHRRSSGRNTIVAARCTATAHIAIGLRRDAPPLPSFTPPAVPPCAGLRIIGRSCRGLADRWSYWRNARCTPSTPRLCRLACWKAAQDNAAALLGPPLHDWSKPAPRRGLDMDPRCSAQPRSPGAPSRLPDRTASARTRPTISQNTYPSALDCAG